MDNWKEISLAGIDQDIKDLVYGYIQAQSFTHSPGEKDAESFFLNYLKDRIFVRKSDTIIMIMPCL